MQLVIDIDEYDYEKVKELVSEEVFDYEGTTAHLFKSVANGTPTRKKGKWINIDKTHSKCDRCESIFEIASANGESNYCPNCGAEMRGAENE